VRCERALDQVGGRLGERIALRGVERTPAMAPDQTGLVHAPCDALAPTGGPRAGQFRVDARHAVGAAARLVDRADLPGALRVSLGAGTGGHRVHAGATPKSRWGRRPAPGTG
jgi:hypothetical protein